MRYRQPKYRAVQDYNPPHRLQHIAEERIGDFVTTFNHQQSFSATLPGTPPRPTLLDLCVSAYLQGVNDTVDAAVRTLHRQRCERPCCNFVDAIEEV